MLYLYMCLYIHIYVYTHICICMNIHIKSYICVWKSLSRVWLFATSLDCSPPGSSVHGYSPSKSTGVGCHGLLQGIFPTQGSNQRLPQCRKTLNCLSHQGSPWMLEWEAYPPSRGSSQPRNWTQVSCIAGGFFTSWATRGAPPPFSGRGHCVPNLLPLPLYIKVPPVFASYLLRLSQDSTEQQGSWYLTSPLG